MPSNSTAILLARLPPMKRILALTASNAPQHLGLVGFAVTDPYLSYATPLYLPTGASRVLEHSHQENLEKNSSEITAAQRNKPEKVPTSTQDQELLPIDPLQLLDQLECTDVGALLLISPIEPEDTETDSDHQDVDFQVVLKNFVHQHYRPILDVVALEPSARQKNLEQSTRANPEMWEEIDWKSADAYSDPSTQAAIALNLWLWKETGGWANTFG